MFLSGNATIVRIRHSASPAWCLLLTGTKDNVTHTYVCGTSCFSNLIVKLPVVVTNAAVDPLLMSDNVPYDVTFRLFRRFIQKYRNEDIASQNCYSKVFFEPLAGIVGRLAQSVRASC